MIQRAQSSPPLSPTTMCSRCVVLVLGIGLSAQARASTATGELELVQTALTQGVPQAQLQAIRAQGDADRVASPLLENPVLEARRERANGPAGAATDVLGASVQLGLGGHAEAEAARYRGHAAGAWLRAGEVQAICAIREGALSLWLATERAQVAATAQQRLDTVLGLVDRLAQAGEIARHERDFLGLTVAAHRHQVDATQGQLLSSRSAVSAHAGVLVDGVQLLPLAPVGAGDAVVAEGLLADPTLIALRHERVAAEHALVAARRAGLPDLTVSVGARWDAFPDGSSRTPGLDLGTGLSMPVFDRNQVDVGARRAALAALDARIAHHESALRGAISAAWQRASALGPIPEAVATATFWTGALDRFSAGESTIDDLLAAATDLEAVEMGVLDGADLRRSARLELSCATGAFPEPELRALFEEPNR
mgnify:CR=1 FL=1